jgi:uncharacterized protein
MKTQIYVNLPVKDLQKSMQFFHALGFSFNMQYTNEEAACMIINEDAYVMLLTAPFFKTFIETEIADAQKVTEVINALSAASKENVNEMVDKALSLGTREARSSMINDFMYSRSFYDLDGHIWEIVWMNTAAFEQG